jgi:Ca2+-binding RTX toxin-like protein
VSAHARLISFALAAAALAAPAAALAVVEPGGGSSFGANTQGWSSVSASCQPEGGLVGEECDAVNSFDGAAGDPAGSLRSRLTVGTGLVRFDSAFVWRSPTFYVGGDPGVTVEGAELTFDRSFAISGIVGLDPEAKIEVAIVDETSGGRTEVVEEDLDADDTVFDRNETAPPPGAITRNDFHHIEIRAEVDTTTTQGGTTGSASVRFDNLSLLIPDPPGNSPGVKFVKPPLDNAGIRAVINSLDVHALSGNGPGGSLVPQDQCTITGTSGADRITATTSNDVICALGGNDKITARGARDVVDTGDNNDRATGSAGGDRLLGLAGKDRLKARRGKDRVGGGAEKDKMFGQGNKDFLAARDGNRDLVQGGAGHADRARVDGSGEKKKQLKDRVRKVELLNAR